MADAAPDAAPPRVAVVTGANRGIGLDTVRQLLQKGLVAHVATTALEAAGVDAKGYTFLSLDVTDAASVAALVKEVAGRVQAVDLLVNNAAVYPGGWTEEALALALATNAWGPAELAASLRTALPSGLHAVLNVSSGYGSLSHLPDGAALRVALTGGAESLPALQAAVAAAPFDAEEAGLSAAAVPAYKVSKAALNSVTVLQDAAWRGETPATRVAAVCPGWVRTRMGGPAATRSVEEGAGSVLDTAAALLAGDATVGGGFFRDGQPLEW